MNALTLTVDSFEGALDRLEAAWNATLDGRPLAPSRVLVFADLGLLLRTLTPARWALLERLAEAGPSSIYALAKLLERDYKNVYTDVAALEMLGLIGRVERKVTVVWDRVRAELALAQ